MVDSQASAAALSPPKGSITTLIREGVMLKSAPRKVVYNQDCKSLVTSNQGKSESEVTGIAVSVDLILLWEQIQKAFNSQNPVEIAQKLGISRQAVYRWRDSKNPPELDRLLEISKVTNTSLDWLLTGTGEKSISPTFALPTQGKQLDELGLKLLDLLEDCEKLKPRDKENILNHIKILHYDVKEIVEKYKPSNLKSAQDNGGTLNVVKLVDEIQADHPEVKAWMVYSVIDRVDLDEVDPSIVSVIREYAGIPEDDKNHSDEAIKNRS